MSYSWIGFDLDGTLALYESGGVDKIGAPIPAMIARLKAYLSNGQVVKIVTARVAASQESNDQGVHDSNEFAESQRKTVQDWCLEHIGVVLPVTASKDFGMIRLYDDRVIQVDTNLGTLTVHRILSIGG